MPFDMHRHDFLAGPPGKKAVDLKAEAKSTKHLLRHKPFNPYLVKWH